MGRPALTATLGGASVQELHLELIRRTTFNDFDGRRVHDDLVAKRSLWLAAMLGREADHDAARGGPGGLGGTLPLLTDLAAWDWHADTLFLLAPTLDAARELLALGQARWRPDRAVIHNSANSRRASGLPPPARVLSLGWD